MAPTFRSGKICYIEMPASDIAWSAEFYKGVFGWEVRARGDGSTAFDDGVNEVSGPAGAQTSRSPTTLRYRDQEFYVAYGEPNTLTTVPQAILKIIFYVGGQKGT